MSEDTLSNWHHPNPLLPVSPPTLGNGFSQGKDQLGFPGKKTGKGPTATARAFSDSNPSVQLASAGLSIISKALPV